MSKSTCPVCETESEITDIRAAYEIHCPRCGHFSIGEMAAGEIKHWAKQQRTNLSGWIRENPECKIYTQDLKILGGLPNLTVGEKAEKLLDYLSQNYPKPGEKIDDGLVFSEATRDDASTDRPTVSIIKPILLGVSRSLDVFELMFLIYDYLISERGFLSETPESYLRITPKGWAHIDSKRQANPNSQIGFIAMWFNESVNGARMAIEKGIMAAGYKPFRVDQKEHNNKIDDEIIAGIRGSKFLVADLTDHRGGVYYEAGFAQGLGLEVVWLCRKSDMEKMHFDIRQYNCIPWEDDKLPELTRALQKRIEASRIGHGPLSEAAAT
jgi:hypothetical protein